MFCLFWLTGIRTLAIHHCFRCSLWFRLLAPFHPLDRSRRPFLQSPTWSCYRCCFYSWWRRWNCLPFTDDLAVGQDRICLDHACHRPYLFVLQCRGHFAHPLTSSSGQERNRSPRLPHLQTDSFLAHHAWYLLARVLTLHSSFIHLDLRAVRGL